MSEQVKLINELREAAGDHAHGEGYLAGLLKRGAAAIKALHAEAEALLAENGRLKQTVEEGLPRLVQQGYEMRTQLEAARGLLRQSRPAVAYESDRGDEAGKQYRITLAEIDTFLAAPGPEMMIWW